MSYTEVLTTARQKIPLAEVGIETIKMRKAMTGAIILEVPGDKDRGKASSLATRLAQILDPVIVRVAAPARIAELCVVGVDVSVGKEQVSPMRVARDTRQPSNGRRGVRSPESKK
jgi:hypothetical protein